MYLKTVSFILFLWTALVFSQENIQVLSVLSDEISETSGLIFHNGKLITHNDSGNSALLFEIDTVSYEIIRTVSIENATNTDWEDLTQDEQYIYIGDIGNNVGTRRDLHIYRISKEEYDQSDTVTAERINYTYEDQTDFSDTSNSDWDAEALFIFNDRLIILTKQWQSMGTDAYSIPKVPGEHVARKVDSYAIDGLVTSATYNPISNVLFLIGYSSILMPFTASFESISTNTSIFSDQVVKTNLNIGLAQTEAITYLDEDTYFFSSEFFSRTSIPAITLEPTLFKFEIGDMVVPETEPEPENGLDKNEVIVYKSRLFDYLEYQSGIDVPIIRRSIFDPLGREVQNILGENIENNRVNLATLQNGIYYLTFYYSDSKTSVPFYKD